MIREWFYSLMTLEDDSDYEDFYDDLDFRTYHIDDRIYGKFARSSKREQRILSHLLAQSREYAMDLEWQLARTGADSYKYDEKEMADMRKEIVQLTKEKAVLQGKNEVLEEQIAYLRRKTGTRNQMAAIDESNSIDELAAVDNAEKETRKDTKYQSKSGTSLQENQMMVAAYWENHWSNQEIAEELGLSVASVRSYLSTIKKHYEVKLTKKGREITFDQKYGGITWNLNFYQKIQDKYPEAYPRYVNG